MAITKWSKEDALFPAFPSFFDDFFGKDYFKSVNTGTTIPAVNVKEEDNQFTIELAAPGLKKEDFKIDLDHNVLTISSEKKEENEEKDKEGKYTKREYSFQSFSRSFTVPENTDGENIQAQYQDGILNITIPKKEEEEKKSKKIEIQ